MSPKLNNEPDLQDHQEATESKLSLDSFQATARVIEPADKPLLHELTVSVFWPHRDHDLDLLIALGEGYLAIDEIGRPIGSAMYFPVGDDFAMLGMMVTPPRLQAQGAGRWLFNRIMADCEGRDLRLSATRAGYWLYERAGFVMVNKIFQHQGVARSIHLPDPVSGVAVRPLCDADRPALLALDRPAFGADRSGMLTALLSLSEGYVAVREGEIVGYALMRRFGRGYVIGPVVAEEDRMAMQIIAPFIQRNTGAFLRLDTPLEEGEFRAFLSAAGLGCYDSVTEMRIGPQRRATDGTQLFGLAAHSLG